MSSDLPAAVTKPGHGSEAGAAARQRQHDVLHDARARGRGAAARPRDRGRGVGGRRQRDLLTLNLVVVCQMSYNNYKISTVLCSLPSVPQFVPALSCDV